jgi:tRNA pseudouridine13 synthase
VGRSLLFNAVLSARVEQRCWDRIVSGDVAEDGLPTGPLWGRGRSGSTDRALAIEEDALRDLAQWRSALEHVGLTQARRRLVVQPASFVGERHGAQAWLSFGLPSGAYATSLLRELGTFDAVGAEEQAA